METCLPNQLKREGWNVVGFHGFNGEFYVRTSWWPTIGIGNFFFLESDTIRSLSRCGSTFSGACDSELVRVAASMIGSRRDFIYVLTLNTHFPIPRTEVSSRFKSLCKAANLSREVCSHNYRINLVLESILENLKKSGVSPIIVITGDHPPPFSKLDDRNKFVSNEVPGFILKPFLSY